MSIPSSLPSSAGRRDFYLLFVADKLSLIYKRHHKSDSEIIFMKIMSPIYLFNFIWTFGLLQIFSLILIIFLAKYNTQTSARYYLHALFFQYSLFFVILLE